MGQLPISMAGRAMLIAFWALACVSKVVFADEAFPTRPVEVVVPWGPGGGSDQTARKIAKYLESELKVSFPVVNAPGGAGVAGVQKMLLGQADGYTFAVSGDYYGLIGSPTAKWKLDKFIPLGILLNQPAGIFVAENSRFKTWADVEKEARAKPNTIKILIAGYGIIDEIHANYFASKGIKLVVVPFANPSERYVSILGGHADLLYEQAGDIKTYLQNKQMRPLLSLTAERFPFYKDIPTAKELGYNITTPQIRWAFMKAGTDPERVKVISDALAKMASTPDYQAYLKDEMAVSDSFVPAAHAGQTIQKMLEDVRKEATAAGMKIKGGQQ